MSTSKINVLSIKIITLSRKLVSMKKTHKKLKGVIVPSKGVITRSENVLIYLLDIKWQYNAFQKGVITRKKALHCIFYRHYNTLASDVYNAK